MKLTMVGHSSIIISDDDRGFSILCDPWLTGRVFNNGWALSPEPALPAETLDRVTHLFISHEHPDHFNFPTLKGLPESFKRRVQVVFQENASTKIPEALFRLGFARIKLLGHLEELKLAADASLYIFQHKHLDSALLVKTADSFVVNANDAELTPEICAGLRKQFGKCDVLASQFSIAGSQGVESILEIEARGVVGKLILQAQKLEAATVVPFASFVYFCMPDNWHMNRYSNSVLDVKRALCARGIDCRLVFPGRTLEIGRGQPHGVDDEHEYRRYYEADAPHRFELEAPVGTPQLTSAIETMLRHWAERYPRWLLQKIGTVKVRVLDLDESFVIDVPNCKAVGASAGDELLFINSQPLHFAFSQPFGIQTLGVSGRYSLSALSKQWKLLRIVSSLYNAEIYLQWKDLFSRQFVRWVWSRKSTLAANALQQYRRFFGRGA